MSSNNCPSRESLTNWVHGTIPDIDADHVVDHLDNCEACEELVGVIERAQVKAIGNAHVGDGAQQGTGFTSEGRCRAFVDGLQTRPRNPGNSVPPHKAETPNRRIRDYELLDRLGHGAMGTVFRSRHGQLNKLVAIKLLAEDLASDPEAVARFHREMQAVGQLQHPNIVQALDAGSADGVPFLTMELVNGVDLSRCTPQREPLQIADACEIIRQAATGLHYAHTKGLIHRDIKPSNLMLTRDADGRCCVKVLDLGLAMIVDADGESQLTDKGQLMGTLQYMAPEQAENTHTVDHTADIYSLGATFYRLLTGCVPFDGPEYASPVKRLRALIESETPPIAERRDDIPADLALLVDRMLSRSPEDRPATMAEVASELEDFCGGHQLQEVLTRQMTASATSNDSSSELVDTASPEGHTQNDAVSAYSSASEPASGFAVESSDAGRRWWRWLALGVVSAAVVVFGVIWLKTDGGYILIETEDPSIRVEVEILKDDELLKTVSIGRDGDRSWYRSGDYEIRLPSKLQDKLRIVGKELTLERNGEEVVTISQVADAIARTKSDVDQQNTRTTKRSIELWKLVDPKADRLEGEVCRIQQNTIVFADQGAGRDLVWLPVHPTGSYRFKTSFGESSQGVLWIVLPVEERVVSLAFFASAQVQLRKGMPGKLSGIPLARAAVDDWNKAVDTSRQWSVDVSFEPAGDTVKIQLTSGNQQYLEWQGRKSQLGDSPRSSPGLAVGHISNEARFTDAVLEITSGEAELFRPDRQAVDSRSNAATQKHSGSGDRRSDIAVSDSEVARFGGWPDVTKLPKGKVKVFGMVSSGRKYEPMRPIEVAAAASLNNFVEVQLNGNIGWFGLLDSGDVVGWKSSKGFWVHRKGYHVCSLKRTSGSNYGEWLSKQGQIVPRNDGGSDWEGRLPEGRIIDISRTYPTGDWTALTADGKLHFNGTTEFAPPADTNDFVAIGNWHDHHIGIRQSGKLEAWGRDPSLLPDLSQYRFAKVRSDEFFTLLLTTDGRLVLLTVKQQVYLPPEFSEGGWTDIVCGHEIYAARRADGR